MSARALIVGIDAYPRNPLEGAVNDAKNFRDALLRLGLATAAETVTLLSDDLGADGPADRDTIKQEITRLYREADEVDRLFFYFAGHGILAFQDPSATQAVTALLPADLESLTDEGDKLIVVEELCRYLRLAGPSEQFYFIDACRDMPYERNPRLGSLGLGDKAPLPQRSQSVLYAVSELNRAVELGERGAMTTHLVAALEGRGRALDYSYEGSPPFVVTMESVRNYVTARLQEIHGPIPMLRLDDPQPQPLRRVANPPLRHLTVHIDPDTAANGTEVIVGLGDKVPVIQLPPQGNHLPAEVEPRPHSLLASSSQGTVDPAQCTVDTREVDEVTVRVGSGPPLGPVLPAVTVAPPPAVTRERDLFVRGELAPEAARDRPAPSGWLSVSARHPLHAVNAIGLEPPYVEERGFGEISREFPAGSYRVEFRQEPDLLAATEIFVADASEVSVQAPEEPEPYQETPAIALQRFARDVFHEVAADARYDVAVAIAIERGPGSLDFHGSVGEVRVTARGRFSSLQTEIDAQRMGWGELGFARIGLGEEPFELHLEGAATGSLRLASIALPGFATLATIHLGPGGAVDLSQILVPRDGTDDAAIARFQIGQGLYRVGDLAAAPIAPFFEEDLRSGRLDPVLAAMTLLAATEGKAGRGDGAFLGRVRELLWNHLDLPDARIALAANAENPGDLLDPLLELQVEPLLDRSSASLVSYALATGREDHPLVARRQSVPPGQPWNLVRDRPDGLQLAVPTATKLLQ